MRDSATVLMFCALVLLPGLFCNSAEAQWLNMHEDATLTTYTERSELIQMDRFVNVAEMLDYKRKLRNEEGHIFHSAVIKAQYNCLDNLVRIYTIELLEERMAQGADVILEIDYQGALQIQKMYANAVLIFILPPSWDELRSRLQNRGEDSLDVIETRLKNAAHEMSQAPKFDFVIINELFERALFDLKAIVHSQRLKYKALRRARADIFQALKLK